jgi:hypothetical protein
MGRDGKRSGNKIPEPIRPFRKAAAGRAAPQSGDADRRKSQRPNNLTLADLFLWITVVDECQFHPAGAFDRAAVTETLKSPGNIQQRLVELEARFGKLFYDGHGIRPRPQKRARKPDGSRRRRNRSGVPSHRGAALAEIFVMIEHLYRWAVVLGPTEPEMNLVRGIKREVLALFPWPPIRNLDNRGPDRIVRSFKWRSRLEARARSDNPGKLSDMPPLRPTPTYELVDHARAAAERRARRKQDRAKRGAGKRGSAHVS